MDVDVRWFPAGVGRRAFSAEARGGEIEGAPPELDGAGLSEKASAEAFEDEVRLQQARRKQPRAIAVIRPDLDVVGERDGDGDLRGQHIDVRVRHSKPVK